MRLHQSWDYLHLLFSIAPTLLGVNDNLLISGVSFVGVEELVTETNAATELRNLFARLHTPQPKERGHPRQQTFYQERNPLIEDSHPFRISNGGRVASPVVAS